MALNRISTLSLQQSTLSNAMRVQNSIFDSQQQISSGQKADTYEQLSGQVEFYTSLENKISKGGQYLKNNQQTLSRLDGTSNSVTQLIDIANSMRNLILQRRTATTANNIGFEQQIEAGFASVAQQLNISENGRYLFAGARTDTKPVDDERLPTLLVEGVPDAGYYQGSGDDITSRIQDGYEITANVRADAQPFQDMIAALSTAMQGHKNGDDTVLVKAYDLMEGAVKGLVNMQSNLGNTRKAVEDANTRHETQITYWKILSDDTIKADVVALTSKLAVDNATLQATFAAFAKINSLRLSDYLS